MKNNKVNGASLLPTWLALLAAFTLRLLPRRSFASSGSITVATSRFQF